MAVLHSTLSPRSDVRDKGRLLAGHKSMADFRGRRCQTGVEAVPTGSEVAVSGNRALSASEMTSASVADIS